ncbi:MAG: hypothetical protein IH991_15080 [Planctomycetes bacterium]|nr:hypothetical protein [Planctomycetota bacterium]
MRVQKTFKGAKHFIQGRGCVFPDHDSVALREQSTLGIVAEAGLERPPQTAGETPNSVRGGAESGALDAQSGAFDPNLQAIIDAWQTLPKSVKADILAMVKAGG